MTRAPEHKKYLIKRNEETSLEGIIHNANDITFSVRIAAR